MSKESEKKEKNSYRQDYNYKANLTITNLAVSKIQAPACKTKTKRNNTRIFSPLYWNMEINADVSSRVKNSFQLPLINVAEDISCGLEREE